jgi:hypothetical protein
MHCFRHSYFVHGRGGFLKVLKFCIILQDLLKAAIPELLGSIKKGVEFAKNF